MTARPPQDDAKQPAAANARSEGAENSLPDCFALLGVPRQPWLDVDAVRRRFLELSSQCHPDAVAAASPITSSGSDAGQTAVATDRFALLNSAYQTLRDAKLRLAHLLELETGTPPSRVQSAGADLADLFFQVSSLCRQIDAFIAERARASSPLAKATLFARGLEWTERLQVLQQSVAQAQGAFDAELQMMNLHWTVGAPPEPTTTARPLSRLEEIYRHLSYLGRWSAQLQERLVQLAV